MQFGNDGVAGVAEKCCDLAPPTLVTPAPDLFSGFTPLAFLWVKVKPQGNGAFVRLFPVLEELVAKTSFKCFEYIYNILFT